MTISVIIPYRKRKGQFENLSRLLSKIKENLPEVSEIIVSKYGPHDKRLDDLNRVSLIKEKTRNVWNRSRSINNGTRYAKNEIILILDSDCIPAPGLDRVSAELMKRFDVIFLWALKENILNAHAAGNMIVKKNIPNDIRGYDEKFEGFGREDKDMEKRVKDKGYYFTYLPFFIKKDDRKTCKPLSKDQKRHWGRNKKYFDFKHGKNAFGEVYGKRIKLSSSFYDFLKCGEQDNM